MSPPSVTANRAGTGSVRFLDLLPGEVPPASGLWAVEFGPDAVSGTRLGGWLGQLDWWSNGLLSRKGLSLCGGGKADLFVGLDWMLSDGLLLIPVRPGDPIAAAHEWAGLAARRCAEMGVKEVSVGLNALGVSGPAAESLRKTLQTGWEAAPGLQITFWTGGLFDPLKDGF